MGRENREIGKIGENAAVGFLRQGGYKILETNYRTPFGEIDIIARQRDFLTFIEVKTRASSSFGPPSLSITRRKQKNIIKNALSYLKRHGLVYSYWRIDVVSVNLDRDKNIENIELIQNAVEEI